MPQNWGRKYAWEDWFKKTVTRLKKGTHYSCSTSAMVQQVRNNASARRVSVTVNEVETDVIEVRVTGVLPPREDREGGAACRR